MLTFVFQEEKIKMEICALNYVHQNVLKVNTFVQDYSKAMDVEDLLFVQKERRTNVQCEGQSGEEVKSSIYKRAFYIKKERIRQKRYLQLSGLDFVSLFLFLAESEESEKM